MRNQVIVVMVWLMMLVTQEKRTQNLISETTENDGFGFELDLDLVHNFSIQSFPYNIPEWDPLPVVLPERDLLLKDDLPQVSPLKNPLKNQPDVGAPQQQQLATCQSSWADDPENEDLPQEQISFILSRIVQ